MKVTIYDTYHNGRSFYTLNSSDGVVIGTRTLELTEEEYIQREQKAIASLGSNENGFQGFLRSLYLTQSPSGYLAARALLLGTKDISQFVDQDILDKN